MIWYQKNHSSKTLASRLSQVRAAGTQWFGHQQQKSRDRFPNYSLNTKGPEIDTLLFSSSSHCDSEQLKTNIFRRLAERIQFLGNGIMLHSPFKVKVNLFPLSFSLQLLIQLLNGFYHLWTNVGTKLLPRYIKYGSHSSTYSAVQNTFPKYPSCYNNGRQTLFIKPIRGCTHDKFKKKNEIRQIEDV